MGCPSFQTLHVWCLSPYYYTVLIRLLLLLPDVQRNRVQALTYSDVDGVNAPTFRPSLIRARNSLFPFAFVVDSPYYTWGY